MTGWQTETHELLSKAFPQVRFETRWSGTLEATIGEKRAQKTWATVEDFAEALREHGGNGWTSTLRAYSCSYKQRGNIWVAVFCNTMMRDQYR